MLTVRIQSACRWTIIVVTAASAGFFLPTTGRFALAQVATTEPTAEAAGGDATTQPASRTPDQVMTDLRADSQELSQVLGDPSALGDEAVRKAVAPKAIPILKKMMA